MTRSYDLHVCRKEISFMKSWQHISPNENREQTICKQKCKTSIATRFVRPMKKPTKKWRKTLNMRKQKKSNLLTIFINFASCNKQWKCCLAFGRRLFHQSDDFSFAKINFNLFFLCIHFGLLLFWLNVCDFFEKVHVLWCASLSHKTQTDTHTQNINSK